MTVAEPTQKPSSDVAEQQPLDKKNVEEMSEEDMALKETLEMLVERICESGQDAALQRSALEALRSQIRSSAVSMTSVPKALKFLRQQFTRMQTAFEDGKSMANEDNAAFLADILSVTAMTISHGAERNVVLKYWLKGQRAPMGDEWGHEYVRHLAMEIISEYNQGSMSSERVQSQVIPAAVQVATFFLDHNAEPDACDLLYELEQLSLLVDLVATPKAPSAVGMADQEADGQSKQQQQPMDGQRDHERVCLYLLSCVPYEADGDDRLVLQVAFQIYHDVAKDYANALLVAMRLNDRSLMQRAFESCKGDATVDSSLCEQLVFLMARQRVGDVNLEAADGSVSERMQNILNNAYLSGRFRDLAKELDVVAPRLPEDIYKSHLQDSGSSGGVLEGLRLGGTTPTSRQNLASSLVSAFVNASFGSEALLQDGGVDGGSGGGDVGQDEEVAAANANTSDNPKASQWIYRNKEHGVLSTVASIGMVHMWDPESGLAHLDRYLYSDNMYVRAGAILGIGLVHVGTRNESDPALALLREYLEEDIDEMLTMSTNDGDSGATTAASKNAATSRKNAETMRRKKLTFRCSALIGLALAYCGTARMDVAEAILPLLSIDRARQESSISSPTMSSSSSPKSSGDFKYMEMVAMAALALGHIFVGTCDGDVASSILQTMMECSPAELSHPMASFMALALALLFLGKTETEAAVILETLRVIEHPIAEDAAALVKICSYVGSGNVVKIQELLQICVRPVASKQTDDLAAAMDEGADQKNVNGDDGQTEAEEEMEAENLQTGNAKTFAVIGIALICMMEDVGKEMSHRLFAHLMQFGSEAVRKAVPLAIGLLHTSDPSTTVMDLLSKYSHDHDKSVAVNAIFAMGLCSAGTNNAKMAQMLRHLSAYYQRDVDCLFMVRIAQGLVHAAKGTVSLSPMHSHRRLISPAALAGLLTTVVALSDAQSSILEHASYLFYFLAPAMYPRFLMLLDADTLEPVPVLVRVGQAVDVVAQAGKPKTISGFQTHTSPVLLAHHDRAELATEEYIALSPVLENFVLVRRNPNWEQDQ